MAIDEAIQLAVRARAKGRCEYCHFPEEFSELPFHVDHIIAKQHGGRTVLGNLALACCFCNGFKGPNLAGVDPVSGKVVRLFDPRRHTWQAHFTWNGPELIGKTATARATIQALRLNSGDAVAVRQLLMTEGVYPLA